MMTQSDILAHKIIDCATAVHNILGGGFQEVTYQRALAVEMGKQNLRFRDSTEVPVFHLRSRSAQNGLTFLLKI